MNNPELINHIKNKLGMNLAKSIFKKQLITNLKNLI